MLDEHYWRELLQTHSYAYNKSRNRWGWIPEEIRDMAKYVRINIV